MKKISLILVGLIGFSSLAFSAQILTVAPDFTDAYADIGLVAGSVIAITASIFGIRRAIGLLR